MMTPKETEAFIAKYKLDSTAVADYATSFKLPQLEAELMYIYDKYFCDSEKDAKWFLATFYDMTEEDYDDSPIKPTKVRSNPAETAKVKAAQTDRLKQIKAEVSENYSEIFGDLTEEESGTLTYLGEDGFSVSIKIQRHKTKKVVDKKVDESIYLDESLVRIKALEAILRANPDLFPDLEVAGSAFGFSIPNGKYPYGSVKLVSHTGKPVRKAAAPKSQTTLTREDEEVLNEATATADSIDWQPRTSYKLLIDGSKIIWYNIYVR